jgi:hypothetical protein
MNSLLQNHYWPLLIACLALFIVTTLIMQRLAAGFFTMGKVRQSFTIFDLEFPSKSSELMKLIRGIDKLPDPAERISSRAALRWHLWVDFLFMAGIYPLIFLLCWKASGKMDSIGKGLFIGLAWAQALAWLLDIIENIYLLRKLSQPEKSARRVHRWYLRVVTAKWILALVGLVCSVFGLMYFWVTGMYNAGSLRWMALLIGMLIGGIVLTKLTGRKARPKPSPIVAADSDPVTLGIEN